MSFAQLLTMQAQVLRRDGTTNSLGEATGAFSPVGDYMVLVQPATAGASFILAGEDDRPSHVLWAQLGADIRIDDRLVTCGMRFRVAGAPMDAAARGHHQEALLYEVPDGC